MKQRYLALDIFRGMTIAFMILVNTPGSWAFIYPPLQHAEWHGCTPTDLIFPSFMFIVGVAMRFSFQSFDYQLTANLAKKILRRTALLFLIGFLLHTIPWYNINWAKVRILGVLQRIALGYCIASFIVLTVKDKCLPHITGVILLGYWAILYFLGDAGLPYEMLTNAAHKLDLLILGASHLYKGEGVPFDPEGLLSTLPSVGTVLLGYLSGKYVQESNDKLKLAQDFAIFGAVTILISFIWDYLFGFPINKKIWTSSYVLFAAGIDLVILAVLIWIVDILGYVRWTKFFHIFGVNSIASYVMAALIAITARKIVFTNGEDLYSWLYNHVYQTFFGDYLGSFLFAISIVLLTWAIMLVLYRQKIFIRL